MEAAGALWRFWHLRGHLREGERTLGEVLAKAPNSPSHGRARALYGKASLTYWRGDYEQSRREYEQCLAIAEAIADDVTIAEAHYAIGFVQVNARDYDGARASYEASRVAAVRTGDDLSVANAIFGSAFVDAIGGPYEDAVPNSSRSYRSSSASATDSAGSTRRARSDGYCSCSAGWKRRGNTSLSSWTDRSRWAIER